MNTLAEDISKKSDVSAISSKIVCNFDTCAAETVFPKGTAPRVPTNTKSTVRYRTASMEYLEDDGGKTLYGENENVNKRKTSGRVIGVHRILIETLSSMRCNTV